MKAHELIEKSIQFYTEGGKPGYDSESGRCKYFIDSTTRCGIGALLSEEDAIRLESTYSSKSMPIHLLFELMKAPDFLVGILPEDLNYRHGINFLQDIQKIHDECASNATSRADFVRWFSSNLEYLPLQYKHLLIT
jgi:hypothetical protein